MNRDLPIAPFGDRIVAAVRDNPVVIITAPTGSGKTTQVPQFLLAERYTVVVTQPRRLAAVTVATRVADEVGVPLGDLVGYRTAHESCDSRQTKLLFCTDGLQLVRELMQSTKRDVLVIDEVHEWNLNIEVLIAWSKMQQREGAEFKLVIMSATLDSQELSSYYDDAPVLTIPGRLYPVEQRFPGSSLEDDAEELLRTGRNVLVFQPGKAEIARTMAILEKRRVNAKILPLHGQLRPEQQERCFALYERPKCVVATNVAQTSVTIPDIDAVVDSGLERRVQLESGVEGLYLRSISLDSSEQRRGRAGRTRPGIYIDHCPRASDERSRSGVPEIQRTRLDQTVLRLAHAGVRAEELLFLHQPDPTDIADARSVLRILGCMDVNGSVSSLGYRVSRMPLSVPYARMIVEAERRGVVPEVITIAAIMETGGILRHWRQPWRHLCGTEDSSDALAQLTAFNAVADMSADEKEEAGILLRAYYHAKEIRRLLRRRLRGSVDVDHSTSSRDDIIKSVVSGLIHNLYRLDSGRFVGARGDLRQLSRSTVVLDADLLVAVPFDLEVSNGNGSHTLPLLTMATRVDEEMLREIAPHLVTSQSRVSPRYDPRRGEVISHTVVYAGGIRVSEEAHPDPDHPDAATLRAAWQQTDVQSLERQYAQLVGQLCQLQVAAFNDRAKHELLSRIQRFTDVFSLDDAPEDPTVWVQQARELAQEAELELGA